MSKALTLISIHRFICHGEDEEYGRPNTGKTDSNSSREGNETMGARGLSPHTLSTVVWAHPRDAGLEQPTNSQKQCCV